MFSVETTNLYDISVISSEVKVKVTFDANI